MALKGHKSAASALSSCIHGSNYDFEFMEQTVHLVRYSLQWHPPPLQLVGSKGDPKPY